MRINGRRCLVCDCQGTMPLDGDELGRGLRTAAPAPQHHLCRSQIAGFEQALAAGEPLLVACTQEAPLFAELAAARAAELDIAFTNIRERAGWSAEGRAAGPKIAALLAEATLAPAPTPSFEIVSAGRCLIYGPGELAWAAAQRLKRRLAVTLVLSDAGGLLPPDSAEFPLFRGRLRQPSGTLGAFAISFDELAAPEVAARAELGFEPPRAVPTTLEADLVVDLSGGAPWFPAAAKRDGYLRPDPRDRLAIERALFDATDLVGTFDKPRYVSFTAALCAHSRSRKTGCTRCLDQCPTGAIAPAGDTVAIDARICAGCGACAAVCPTGAATYAMPQPGDLLTRLRTLLTTYHEAGGRQPVVLAYEARHGEPMIATMARLGRGLPARVIPLPLGEIAQLGFDAFAAAFAYGAAQLLLLAAPVKRAELGALELNRDYAERLLDGLGFGRDRIRVIVEDDPEALEAVVWELPRRDGPSAGSFLPLGGKRERMRLALDQLHAVAPAKLAAIAMPAGAPFGAVRLDAASCTLCLACVGACPTGALLDNPERPTLRFVEDACVQCGLCASTCPERVIALEPRLAFTAEARGPVTLKEEEPATCVRCGKPFGTRSSIERIVRQLAGAHPMFQTPEHAARLRMCDDCRVVAQFEVKDNPLALGTPPRPRTTDDYLREREELEAARRRLAADEPDGSG